MAAALLRRHSTAPFRRPARPRAASPRRAAALPRPRRRAAAPAPRCRARAALPRPRRAATPAPRCHARAAPPRPRRAAALPAPRTPPRLWGCPAVT
ncbi:hypothetical protein AB0I92_21395 [Micromonospora chalcea]|uniref:hypothetical protein n=1 Tax=Micromonospora chalcea TaxID=1874 RepID=UPI0033F75F32